MVAAASAEVEAALPPFPALLLLAWVVVAASATEVLLAFAALVERAALVEPPLPPLPPFPPLPLPPFPVAVAATVVLENGGRVENVEAAVEEVSTEAVSEVDAAIDEEDETSALPVPPLPEATTENFVQSSGVPRWATGIRTG